MHPWKTIIKKSNKFEIKKGLTSFVNPYSMLVLEKEPDICKDIDCWYVDGISLVHLINKRFQTKLDRFSFDETSLAPIVFAFAREKQLKLGIVGTKQEFLIDAIRNIEEKHSIKISYYRNGYFHNSQEVSRSYDQIIKQKIDIVICGMGTPYQEKFLIGLKNSGWSGYGYTCGGYLHQIADKKEYYPSIFDNLNIRWLYRIFDEPKLLRRYLINYPKFFYKYKTFDQN